MIKQTFYNLPEEKRNRISQAILKEFSSASTEKVSINRIIKAAKISRGSFYQYFDDKVDLVEILIKTFFDVAYKEFRNAITHTNGNIFDSYIKIFETVTDLSKDAERKCVLKNLFKNLKANDSLISDYLANRFDGDDEIKNLSKSFDREQLRFKSDEDVELLKQILTQLLKNAIFNVYVNGKQVEEVRKNFLRKIEIIKKGATTEE